MANAELKGPGELSHAYRSVVRYHCRVGTLMGPNEVWCTQDGTWSAAPTCEGVCVTGGRFWPLPLRTALTPA